MKIILVCLFFIFLGVNCNTTETIEYCAKVTEESTETKVNLTTSSVDSKNYCVEGRTRVIIFDEVSSGDQYVYLSEHYCANLQNYPISCEQYYNSGYYDYKVDLIIFDLGKGKLLVTVCRLQGNGNSQFRLLRNC